MNWLAITMLLGALLSGSGASAPPSAGGMEGKSEKELLEAFGAELPDKRLEAARAIAKIGPEVVPKLSEALEHKDWRVRRSATDALAELRADAKPAVPALARALKDRDAWVRAGAAVALGRIGPEAGEAAPALAEAAVDDDMWVRKYALESLARGKVTDDEKLLLRAAVGAIAIRESGWAAKRFAMGILSSHGKDYKPAIPALVRVLEAPPEGMWDGTPRVVELLDGMGAADKAVPHLIKLLDPKRRHIPRRAADSLAKLGKAAAPALPALRTLAKEAVDKGSGEAARKAIEQIEAATEKK
jgi:HEAT repeat protein